MQDTLETVTSAHWTALLKACCVHAALPTSVLHEYPDELDWRALSRNPGLDWTIDLARSFRTRWVWHELLRNPGIPWDHAWREAFRGKLDWYYLSQNAAILDADLLEAHADEVVWGLLARQPGLTDALRERLAEHLEEHEEPETPETPEPSTLRLRDVLSRPERAARAGVDLDTLVSDATPDEVAAVGKWLIASDAEPALASLSGAWVPVWLAHGDATSARLYDEGIAPLLEPVGGFAALLRDRREACAPYVVLAPIQRDERGLLPAVEFPETEDARGRVRGTLSTLREGPVRVKEVPSLAKAFRLRIAVVDRLLPLVQAHHLPPHRVLPLAIPDDPAGRSFHVIHFDHVVTDAPPVTLDEAWDLVPWSKTEGRTLTDLIASRRLIAALRDAGATGVGVSSALHLGLDAPEPPAVPEVTVPPRRAHDPRSRAFREAEAKLHRLASAERRLPEDHDASDPVWGAVEERLQVVFPASFRERYTEGGAVGLDFRYLPTGEMQPLDGYTDTHPELAGAVVVARNQLGDAVVLRLLKRSMFALGATLYETRHETGEVTRLRKGR